MILRAAIIVLLVLNLGVAAWWISGGDAVPRRDEPATPAGTPGLRLVSEAARPLPAPVTAAAPVPAPAPPAAPEPQATPTNVVQCLRFGPFADAAARDAARATLSAAGVASEPRDTPARTGRGWKVHVPAFASREEAKAMGEKIKAAGIGDWYVMNEGSDANSIALGRYGSEEAARRREAELKAKGIPALAEPLGAIAPQSWLDARVAPGIQRAALAPAGPSRPVDCARPG